MKNDDLVTKGFLEEKITSAKEELNEVFKKYRDDIMEKLDFIVKELETAREDRELAVYPTNNLEERVDIHEKRITKLENKN